MNKIIFGTIVVVATALLLIFIPDHELKCGLSIVIAIVAAIATLVQLVNEEFFSDYDQKIDGYNT